MWSLENPGLSGWAQLLVGALLLFFGRRLFWVFVGAIGFVAGVHIAGRLAAEQPELLRLLFALGLGLIGALVAVLLQRIAVAVAGWIAGGYLAYRLAVGFGLEPEWLRWAAFIVGAVVAALLVSLLFEWALIVLSALTGAVLISDASPWSGQPIGVVVIAILFALGALAQFGVLGRSRRSTVA
jgi:hypothetical protein